MAIQASLPPLPTEFQPHLAPQTVDVLPDPTLPAITRALTTLGGHTYAAIWPYVRRADKQGASRELIFVRDDGQLLSNPGLPDPAASPAPYADSALPSAVSLLPPHCLWSAAGLQRYIAGQRPDPADVYRRLLAVLTHFVDFTGSIAWPAWSGHAHLPQPDESVPAAAELLAAYVLSTWFAPALPVHGLLWITGDHGSGKTRLLVLLARLAHLGVAFPGLPSSGPLLRLAGLGAALAVDNANFLGPARESTSLYTAGARRSIVLAGREPGAFWPALYRSPGGRLVNLSGPRLFAATGDPDSTLAGSCLVIPLLRTADPLRATLDPADPAAWPPGIDPAQLTDDLWALALSRLPQLPPHLALVAGQAAGADPRLPSQANPPLRGAPLQPWHAPLAVASWLSDQTRLPPDPNPPALSIGVGRDPNAYHAVVAHTTARARGAPGLYDRLLILARNVHAARPVSSRSDITILALRALYALVGERVRSERGEQQAANAYFARLEAALTRRDAAGGEESDDDDDAEYADDLEDDDDEGGDDDDDDDEESDDDESVIEPYDYEKAIKEADAWRYAALNDNDDDDDATSEVTHAPPPPLVRSVYTFTPTQVAQAMLALVKNQESFISPDQITPNIAGRLLGQLRLTFRRTSDVRLWSTRPAELIRLSQAYSEPLPPELAQALANFQPPTDPLQP